LKNGNDERIKELNRDHSSEVAEKSSKIDMLENKIVELNKNADSYKQHLEDYISSAKDLQEKLKSEQALKLSLESELSSTKSECSILSHDIQNSTEQIKNVKLENENLSQQIKSYRGQLDVLKQENSTISASGDHVLILQRENEELKLQLTESGDKLKQKDTELLKLQDCLKESSSYETELFSVREQYESVLEKYMSLQKDFEQKESTLKSQEGDLKTLQDENEDYKSRIESLIDDYTSLESELNQSKEQSKIVENLNEQISRLKRNVSDLNEKVAMKEQNILLIKESNSKYKAELDVALKKAESARSFTASGGDVNMQIKTERDSLQKQVDFLNSVIVDLNNKNEHLQKRYEAAAFLDSGANNVDTGDNYEDDSPVKNLNHNLRLFCDICDEFDLHNTEDCPIQAARPESPQGSRNRGSVNEVRPFCEVCDCFDHWTEDCEDDQMF